MIYNSVPQAGKTLSHSISQLASSLITRNFLLVCTLYISHSFSTQSSLYSHALAYPPPRVPAIHIFRFVDWRRCTTSHTYCSSSQAYLSIICKRVLPRRKEVRATAPTTTLRPFETWRSLNEWISSGCNYRRQGHSIVRSFEERCWTYGRGALHAFVLFKALSVRV